MIPEEYVQGSFALELCGYLSINADARITIDVGEAVVLERGSFNGILNNGTFHQMGGTVTVNQSKYIAMLTHGVTLVNGGTLNLSADIGYVQGYDFDRPADAPSWFFVNGGTVNATGNNIGILLNGPANWAGGQVNAVATGDGSGGVTPQAVLVQRYTGDGDENVSSLTITGGTHTLTAVGAANTGDRAHLRGEGLYDSHLLQLPRQLCGHLCERPGPQLRLLEDHESSHLHRRRPA